MERIQKPKEERNIQLKQILRHDSLKILLSAAILTLTSSIHYLLTMASATDPGLVFDDSYIHLQYARTIYDGTPWQYNPGEISTGSTSPLWAIVLSRLFFISSDATSLIWGVYVVAALLYTASTFLVGQIAMEYTSSRSWALVAMTGFVYLPRNTLLMLSGMETPLFLFLVLLSITVMDRMEPVYDPIIGIIAGLTFLTRPEGVLIAVVCIPVRFLILAIEGKLNHRRIIPLLGMLGIMVTISSTWLLLCLEATGYPLPATFYAKVGVTDYAITVWNNHWVRWYGRYLYLLPSIILGVILVFHKKPHIWLFAISLAIAYRFTLPYMSLINHARYLVPVFDLLAVNFILIAALLQRMAGHRFSKHSSSEMAKQLDLGTKVITIGIVCMILFSSIVPQYFKHAQLHAQEVKNTNERQVIIGCWLRENTPEDAVLAIHDAGALRFYSERRIIDLAGLVSPDITFGNMTATEKLSYLRAEGCEYFVFFDRMFKRWIYYLGGAYTVLYDARIPDCVLPGNANMSVYYINWSLTSIS